MKNIKQSWLEITIISVAFIAILVYAFPVLSVTANEQIADTQWETQMAVETVLNNSMPWGTLPEAAKAPAREVAVMSVTAYNSVPWQTDDTPCIGAQGTDICEIYATGENICAANFVRLGTILEVEGLGTCTVRDRMNSRYHYRVDWYMGMDIAGARQLGISQRMISVYPGI